MYARNGLGMGRNQIRSEFTRIRSDSTRTPTIPLGFLPFHLECVGEGKVLVVTWCGNVVLEGAGSHGCNKKTCNNCHKKDIT